MLYYLTFESTKESHMFEAEVKSNIVRIATLEQELKSEVNERKKVELEFNSFKEKQAIEFQVFKLYF
jgi:hypothetical protein